MQMYVRKYPLLVVKVIKNLYDGCRRMSVRERQSSTLHYVTFLSFNRNRLILEILEFLEINDTAKNTCIAYKML